jgi:demethylmenaquinone methyltransferase/2-methoxy-6-polyprenyl-1,4-benzoquinol methylase
MNDQFYLIAKEYDFLNLLMTAGLIFLWRAQLKNLQNEEVDAALDLASGTGSNFPYIKARKIFGLDIDLAMLKLQNQRFPSRYSILASAEKIPFENNSFDSIVCSFGFRNFRDVEKVLNEINRTLKSGGKLYITEIFRSGNLFWEIILKLLFKLYIIPLSKLFSKNPCMYEYFLSSIQRFLTYDEFLSLLNLHGFRLLRTYHWGPLKILKLIKA